MGAGASLANHDANVTLARSSGSGNNSGAALDLYGSVSGSPVYASTLVLWGDSAGYTGGKARNWYWDVGGNAYARTALVVSGHVSSPTNPYGTINQPSGDPYMIAVWSDINAPALITSPNTGSTAGQSAFQAFAVLDSASTPKERFAIDGAGLHQWSAAVANTYAGSTWDTSVGRVSAGRPGRHARWHSIFRHHVREPRHAEQRIDLLLL
jgi:hypothetical protein